MPIIILFSSLRIRDLRTGFHIILKLVLVKAILWKVWVDLRVQQARGEVVVHQPRDPSVIMDIVVKTREF